MDELFAEDFVGKYSHDKLSSLSPEELASYFVEGTLDRRVNPTITDVARDRYLITNYLAGTPEDFQNEFGSAIMRMLPEDWSGRRMWGLVMAMEGWEYRPIDTNLPPDKKRMYRENPLELYKRFHELFWKDSEWKRVETFEGLVDPITN